MPNPCHDQNYVRAMFYPVQLKDLAGKKYGCVHAISGGGGRVSTALATPPVSQHAPHVSPFHNSRKRTRVHGSPASGICTLY